MIIDSHAHGFYGGSLNRLEGAGGDWAKKGLGYLHSVARRKPHMFDVGLRVEMLDRNSIDLQVVNPVNYLDCNLLPADAGEQLRLAEAINDTHLVNVTHHAGFRGGDEIEVKAEYKSVLIIENNRLW